MVPAPEERCQHSNRMPTVAEPDMSDLHGHRRAAQQDNLVAPIELIGFARSKTQRHKRCGGCLPAFLSSAPSIAAHGVVAAVISAPAQLLEQPDQRQTFA